MLDVTLLNRSINSGHPEQLYWVCALRVEWDRVAGKHTESILKKI